jgi:hypothetical protein
MYPLLNVSSTYVFDSTISFFAYAAANSSESLKVTFGNLSTTATIPAGGNTGPYKQFFFRAQAFGNDTLTLTQVGVPVMRIDNVKLIRDPVDASTLVGRSVAGYQGWFRSPADPGSGNTHYTLDNSVRSCKLVSKSR